ncbi:MAG: hypothetical protein ACIALR_10680 [Blastopirellula sp. JB062]
MSSKLAQLRCPQCAKSLGIPRKLAGKTSPCPKCGVQLAIADDLSQLSVRSPSDEAEPIVAEAVEPPLAMSVEKTEPSRFPWLIAAIVGVTLLTLVLIGGVVWGLSQYAAQKPTPGHTPPSAVSVDEAATQADQTAEPEPAEAKPAPSSLPDEGPKGVDSIES